jgi:putative ABC transport system permease protein
MGHAGRGDRARATAGMTSPLRWRRWRARRAQREAEIDAEIQAHLDLEASEQRERGLSALEADHAARRAFGNTLLVREDARNAWRWAGEQTAQDVRFAIRMMRRSPGVTIAAVFTLAVGIGLNTAIFSFADALLFRPLAIRHPDTVVTIRSTSPEAAFDGISYPDFKDFRERNEVFEGLIAHRLALLAVAKSADDLPRMRMGMRVSRDFFQMLGVQPVLGRAFLPDETDVPGRDAVAVLGHHFWISEFGGDPNVIGRTMLVAQTAVTIVGVAPSRFTGMDPVIQPYLYVPASLGNPSVLAQRGERGFIVRGRLRRGISRERAQAELAAIAATLANQFPDTNRNRGVSIRTERQLRQEQAPALFPMVALLLVLAAVVLAVVCFNVANLLMARARVRSREIAIRLAIGSGQPRLMRQLFTESIVLALAGGLVGVGLSVLVMQYLSAIRIPTDTPMVIAVQMDHRVLVFSAVAAVACALAFGLAPGWQLFRTDLITTLKRDDVTLPARRRSMFGRQTLVVGQIALSLLLLITAGIMLEAFRKMLVLDPGFRIDGIMMTEFDPGLIGYSEEQSRAFYQQLVDRARTVPGVRAVSLARAIPFRPNFTEQLIVPEHYQLPPGQQGVRVSTNVVDEGYFQTMGVAIMRGRPFTVDDRPEGRRTAIVNDTFAAMYWPNQDPIGKRLRLDAQGKWTEVVAVSRTARYLSVAEPPTPHVYLPLSQHPQSRLTLLVDVAGDALAIADPLRDLVRSLDLNMPVFNVRTLRAMYHDGALGTQRLVLQMVGVMALLALALAVVGLYAVMTYSVGRRMREFGVRISVGARRTDILALVLGDGLRVAAAGILLGLLLSVPIRRLLSVHLVGVGPVSLWTFLVVPLALSLVAVMACLAPAWRASIVNPTTVLRLE